MSSAKWRPFCLGLNALKRLCIDSDFTEADSLWSDWQYTKSVMQEADIKGRDK